MYRQLKVFRKGEQNKLIKFMEERKKNRIWLDVDLKNSPIRAINIMPLEFVTRDKSKEKFHPDFPEYILQEIASDSGSQTIITCNKLDYTVDSNALTQLLERLGDNSPNNIELIQQGNKVSGLTQEETQKLGGNNIIDILENNKSLKKNIPAKALLLDYSIVALNGENYVVLEQDELIQEILNFKNHDENDDKVALDERVILKYAEYDLNITHAEFELPGIKKVIEDVYISSMKNYGSDIFSDVLPGIIFRTSDTGNSAVSLTPVISYKEHGIKRRIMVGCPIEEAHKGSASISKFQNLLTKMFVQINLSIEDIVHASTTIITTPTITVENFFEKIGFPIKAKDIVIEWINNNPSTDLTILKLNELAIDSLTQADYKDATKVRFEEILYKNLICKDSKIL